MSYETLYHNYGGSIQTEDIQDIQDQDNDQDQDNQDQDIQDQDNPNTIPETEINAATNEVNSSNSDVSSGESNPLPSITEAEALLDMIRLNSITHSDYHNQQYHRYKYLYYYCQVPIIILSACSAFISSGTHPFLSQPTITIITTSMSLCIGIITSLNMFFNVQGNTEAERIAHKKYYLLSVEIMHMLYLQKGKKDVDLNLFVNQKLQDYLRINASSGVVPDELDDLLLPTHPIVYHPVDRPSTNKFKNMITKICRPQKYRRNKQHKRIQRAGLELLQTRLIPGAVAVDTRATPPQTSPLQTPSIRASFHRVYPHPTH